METYEQKYKNALGWMRDVYPTLTGAAKEDAEHYFPELKESEDERIRKEIIQSIQDNMCVIHKDKCIVWLEKQDAQTIKEALRTEYEKGRYDMREEIMKDAVDGEVIEVLDDDCSICGHAHLELFFDQYTLLENSKDGDKVKLIIVKED